jgi:hypothetical protein
MPTCDRSSHITHSSIGVRVRVCLAFAQRAAAQLARVVMSAQRSQMSLSTGLHEAQAELGPLRKAVVNAASRLRDEQEQHKLTKTSLKHASTRAQVLEQRLCELSKALSE